MTSTAGEIRCRRFFAPTIDSIRYVRTLHASLFSPFFSVVPSIAALLCSQTDCFVFHLAGRKLANEKFGVFFKPRYSLPTARWVELWQLPVRAWCECACLRHKKPGACNFNSCWEPGESCKRLRNHGSRGEDCVRCGVTLQCNTRRSGSVSFWVQSLVQFDSDYSGGDDAPFFFQGTRFPLAVLSNASATFLSL